MEPTFVAWLKLGEFRLMPMGLISCSALDGAGLFLGDARLDMVRSGPVCGCVSLFDVLKVLQEIVTGSDAMII